jgi:hypothetical protein
VNFEHSIDEKEWMAVRKVAEDRTDVQAERISHGRHPAQWSIGSVGAAYCGNIVTPAGWCIKKLLQEHIDPLSSLQRLLYAYSRYSLLLVFQAMDAAGKDSAIFYVMSGVNPQGCNVHSFKHRRMELQQIRAQLSKENAGIQA